MMMFDYSFRLYSLAQYENRLVHSFRNCAIVYFEFRRLIIAGVSVYVLKNAVKIKQSTHIRVVSRQQQLIAYFL